MMVQSLFRHFTDTNDKKLFVKLKWSIGEFATIELRTFYENATPQPCKKQAYFKDTLLYAYFHILKHVRVRKVDVRL